jgi:hypothetical protein
MPLLRHWKKERERRRETSLRLRYLYIYLRYVRVRTVASFGGGNMFNGLFVPRRFGGHTPARIV